MLGPQQPVICTSEPVNAHICRATMSRPNSQREDDLNSLDKRDEFYVQLMGLFADLSCCWM